MKSQGRSSQTWQLLLWVLLGAIFSAKAADTVSLTPTLCCDGLFVVTNAGGQQVWQNTGSSAYMYFNVPGTFTFTQGVPVYLQVVYFDEGAGTLQVQYDSTGGSYSRSELHTRSSRVNTKAFATNYHQLASPALLGRQNGSADFRINLGSGGSVPLSVRSVTIQNFPFPDPQLQVVLSKPWLQPYAGATREDVDRSTLKGKMMAGYQGWFRAPNDHEDRGWGHWGSGAMDPASFTIDMWPDTTDYAPHELFPAGDLKTRSGYPAKLFSSTTPETVRRHFQWMRKYKMDGAFLQRFVTRGSSGAYGANEFVLHAVRAAAHQEGRIWAIEYDISALDETNALEIITNDWRWLCDSVRIREDSRYAYEGPRPVVAIWGLPFADREISQPTGNAIVDFFRNDPVYGGNYIIGGVPNGWRSMTAWYPHFQRYHCLLAWMPQSASGYQSDLQQAQLWGLDYLPHVWPGFSWAHLQDLPNESQYTPRNGGEFFWRKISEALGSGANRLFIGMFDEYDEGTAIMPFTDDPPDPHAAAGRFITNLGRPVDWWMILAAEAREMMLGNRPFSTNAPLETEILNRPNIGPEANIDLGSTDVGTNLVRVGNADGNTAAENFGGRDCRYNPNPVLDRYFYFDVADSFLHASSAGADVTIEFDYYDQAGNIPLALQYDSTNNIYQSHPKTFLTRGSSAWRIARFNIADCHFGNRQNGGADFRIAVGGSAIVHIDRVRVALPDSLKFEPTSTVLVNTGAVWRYLDDGSNQGTAWREPAFNDAAWKSGRGQFGYGEGDEATVVSFGPSTQRHITAYFRHAFVVSDPRQFVSLVMGILRDDGAVAYLNGTEIYRTLLPSGTIAYNTFATNTVNGSDEVGRFERNVEASLLVAGTNILAVEIHQPDRTSSDLSFDFILTGFPMTNLPAGVVLSAPADNTEFVAPVNIPLRAAASSGSPAPIARVDFLAGTNLLAQRTTLPYEFNWINAPLGTHSLSARATTVGGIIFTSSPISIKVVPFIQTTQLVSRGATWRYLDTGTNAGTSWRGTNFNDSTWASGPARLGYGADGEVTTLGFGTNASNKYITYYFRRGFNVPDLAAITNLTFRLLRDDGAVIYLNSNEVYRSNMPGGAINHLTPASGAVSGGEEQTYFETFASTAFLRQGTNILAIEVHQNDAGSSDLAFDLELIATGPPPPSPRLKITRSDSTLRLTWPTSATGYQLQSVTNLNLPINWAVHSTAITTSNTENVVTFSAQQARLFFRLSK